MNLESHKEQMMKNVCPLLMNDMVVNLLSLGQTELLKDWPQAGSWSCCSEGHIG